MDIGANEPKHLSNTFLLYREGARGILVEPNPELCKKLKKIRKEDVVLNCGIAEERGKLLYYMMDSDKLNSFSEEVVSEYQRLRHKMLGTKEIEVYSINDVLDKYAPLVVCIETQEHGG